MRTLTAAEMREVDRRCIEDLGMPGAVLMNNAGAAVFREVLSRGPVCREPRSAAFPTSRSSHHGGDVGNVALPVGVVCGKGNNGGDGFVVARLALLAGYETRVVLVGERESVRGDAGTFLRVYENLGGEVSCAPGKEEAAEAVRGLRVCAVVVDALLGTGIAGEVRGATRAAIAAWPDAYTVAVDLPSGLNADTGEVCGCCVKADVTVTLQYAKRGFENPDAKAYLGRLVVADIGIPDVCAEGL